MKLLIWLCIFSSQLFSQRNYTKTKTLESITIRTQKQLYKKEQEVMNIDFVNKDLMLKTNAPLLLESVQCIPGVRSQVSCNVCNTADIRINGMEGANTLILIDGMPIVSGLGSVYGLFGIPTGIIHRMEIAKGPAASQFGIEAIGGTINIITESPSSKNKAFIDIQSNTYGEQNADLSISHILSPKVSAIWGAHAHYFNSRHDINEDGFIDKALTKRLSLFNKWEIKPNHNQRIHTAYRILYENRLGGQMTFTDQWKGTDSIYGEYIETMRGEWLEKFTQTISETTNLEIQMSANAHRQISYYGLTPYHADQAIGFGQIIFNHKLPKHSLQAGTSHRYTIYDDNTAATSSASNIYMPGLWLQDQHQIDSQWSILLSSRIDYTLIHGPMLSPRLGLKFNVNHATQLRLNLGQGHRIVNVFSEDHAALSGGRQVQFLENLRPESSYNLYSNLATHLDLPNGLLNIDFAVFYNYFSNKIIADYDTDPEKILYKNLTDHAQNYGTNLQLDAQWSNGLNLNVSATLLQSYWVEGSQKRDLLYTPKAAFTSMIAYTLPKTHIETNLQAFITGPMRMPVFDNDYRPEYSPTVALFHLNFSKKMLKNKLELYLGIRNILNYWPKVDVIMRHFDPFDKRAIDPVSNPYNYTFEPSYNFASLQVRTLMIGFRLKL